MRKLASGVALSVILVLGAITYFLPAAATEVNQESVSDWTVIDGKNLLSDPVAAKILQNIELSKKILAELQNPKPILTEHQKFVEQQRQIAKQKLEEDLARMNKKYEDFTPKAAFSKYVSKKPDIYHAFYWELFDHMYSKVTKAREVRDNILANGGSYSDALNAFVKHAKIPKAERDQLVEDLILKHGLINKVSDMKDFNELPLETKNAFFTYLKSKGISDSFLIPYEDPKPKSDETSHVGETEVITILLTSRNPNNFALLNESKIKFADLVSDETYEKTKSYTNEDAEIMQLSGNHFVTKVAHEMNYVSEFTISVWVKPDYSKGSSEFTIISKENSFKLSISKLTSPEKIAKFTVFDGFSWNTIESSSTINEEWTHLAATFDGPTIKLYINGNLEASKEIDNIPTLNKYGYVEPKPLEKIYSESDILIGAQQITKRDDISSSGFFSGLVDEILIDNKVLDGKEITELCTESKHFSA